MDPIYLDYNATTPVDPLVTRELLPFLEEQFGNPSSNHPYGKAAREAVDLARARVAGLLGCSPAEIIFTSGGTESNNQALIGFAFANRYRGNHLISTQVKDFPPQCQKYADILEGHYSSALCHLANISYRLGEQVPFYPRTQTIAAETFARGLGNLNGNPAEVLTLSIGFGGNSAATDQWSLGLDHLVATYSTTIVVAAGNEGPNGGTISGPPSGAFNILSVGALLAATH